jgi:hypothetical protein
MPYPKHFPEGCPPLESDTASGEIYRFINKEHEAPMPKDFVSWREENPGKALSGGITECQACGLSVYTSSNEVKRLTPIVPKLRKMKVAKGILKGEMGKIKNTPSRTSELHHTWWILTDSKPWKHFELIEPKNEEPTAT